MCWLGVSSLSLRSAASSSADHLSALRRLPSGRSGDLTGMSCARGSSGSAGAGEGAAEEQGATLPTRAGPSIEMYEWADAVRERVSGAAAASGEGAEGCDAPSAAGSGGGADSDRRATSCVSSGSSSIAVAS